MPTKFTSVQSTSGVFYGADGAIVLEPSKVYDSNGKVAHGVLRGSLAALDTGGGVLSVANPLSTAIIVKRIIFDVTTKSTGACTVDVGVTATSATTSADNLMDGLDVGTAAGVFDNIENQGTNGKSTGKVAVGKWITASMASGAAAGLVGTYIIEYVQI
jgi:hypothetical protein